MITNYTTYTKHKNKQLTLFGFKTQVIPRLIIGEMLFLIGFVIALLLENELLISITLVLFIVIPIMLVLVYFLQAIHFKRKNPSIRKDRKIKFELHDSHFIIFDLDKGIQKSIIYYDELYCVKEDRHNFYLYLNPQIVYLFDKFGFENVALDDVRTLFKTNIKRNKLH